MGEINELLKVIQAVVEAREMSDTMKIQEKKGTETTPTPKRGFSPGTANSLLARSGDRPEIRCAFCNGEHYSCACEEVKEIQKRKNILRRDNVVFCVCQWLIVQTSVPARKSVEFVTGKIIISQFVK